MIPDAALGRRTRRAVLHPITKKRMTVPLSMRTGTLTLQHAFQVLAHGPQTLFQVEHVSRQIEVLECGLKGFFKAV
jgi:hypothetical protein